MVLAGLFVSSCSSLPEENAKLRHDVAVLRVNLLQSYRDSFEKYEYSKLTQFEKKGYEWYWSLSWIESSGQGTKRERERIEKEHGKDALALWDKGWHVAYSMHCKSCEREPVPLKERESPTKPSTATE